MSTLKVGAIRGVSASEDAITVSNDGTATGNFTNRKGKNLVINGGMTVSQRATTASGVGGGAAIDVCDRWKRNIDLPSGVSDLTMSKETDAPNGFSNSLKVTPNQARNAALSGADRFFLQQIIEASSIRTSGWNYTDPNSKLTLSFYIKSNLTGVVSIEVTSEDSPSATRNFYGAVTINSANTWERKTLVIPGHADLVMNNDNNNGFAFTFMYAAGPSFTSGTHTTGQWSDATTGNRASSSNIDIFSNASNFVSLTGVQLELGSKATDFEHEPYCDTARKCFRYYYASRSDGTLGGVNLYASGYFGFGLNDNRIGGGGKFPEPMRAVPTMTLVRPADGATNGAHLFRGVTGSNGGVDQAGTSVSFVDVGHFGYLYLSFTTATQGGGYLYHIIADAEL